MDPAAGAMSEDVLVAQALADLAARRFAHDKIVFAYRAQLCGSGPGPTEGDLQAFARHALVEQTHVRLRQGGD
jgi:hypothetical protein